MVTIEKGSSLKIIDLFKQTGESAYNPCYYKQIEDVADDIAEGDVRTLYWRSMRNSGRCAECDDGHADHRFGD